MSHCENDDCAIDELELKIENAKLDYTRLETDFQALQDAVSRLLNFVNVNTIVGIQPMLATELDLLQEVYDKVKFK